MGNHEIAALLEQTARLMEVHGENSFKIRSIQSAAFKIERLPEKLEGKTVEELALLDGIGKSLSQKIHQLLTTGKLNDLEELVSNTPPGILALLEVKGLGPKKIAQLWKELEITSPGELLYACNENRLVELKGFGAKTQDTLRAAVMFKQSQQGLYHYATAEKSALSFMQTVQQAGPTTLTITGDLRRKCEVLRNLDFLATEDESGKLQDILSAGNGHGYTFTAANAERITGHTPAGIPITIHLSSAPLFTWNLWRTTGNDHHLAHCDAINPTPVQPESITDEAAIYAALHLPYIEPEMREGRNETVKAKDGKLPARLITTSDLRGILHNHSTYSDGRNTLKEMALACRDAGYEYLGICDHSRSAQYAGGLSIESVQKQQEEIKKLNETLAPFRIFSGIESDILADGSLDYPDDILSTFDFIVASVHSGLRMDQEKATRRLLTAIQHPCTTILGHPTGRLLLSREGYPIDHEAVLRACAAAGVVVELNAHPYRLDLDWRWIERAMELGVLISINPDAHSTEGYHDMYYGVCCARKGGLTPACTFNTKNLTEITQWFEKRKAAV